VVFFCSDWCVIIMKTIRVDFRYGIKKTFILWLWPITYDPLPGRFFLFSHIESHVPTSFFSRLNCFFFQLFKDKMTYKRLLSLYETNNLPSMLKSFTMADIGKSSSKRENIPVVDLETEVPTFQSLQVSRVGEARPSTSASRSLDRKFQRGWELS